MIDHLDFKYGSKRSPTRDLRPRARRRHGIIPVQGHSLNYPCGHDTVWPATDLPVRDPGEYAFTCATCGDVHYLFVHMRAVAGHVPVEWDVIPPEVVEEPEPDVPDSAPVAATDATVVSISRGQRLRVAPELAPPQRDRVVVALDGVGRAHRAQARSLGGSSVVVAAERARVTARARVVAGLRVQSATRSA